MKVAILIIAVCLVGAQAQDTTDGGNIFSKLGDVFKNTANHVATNGKTIVEGLLGQLQQAGGQLLQSTLLKLMEHLGNAGIGGTKRDVEAITKVQEAFQKFKAHFEERKQKVGGMLKDAMSKLREVMEKMSNMSFLKHPAKEIEKKIDGAVQHHEKVVKRFLIDSFGQLGNSLTGAATGVATKLGSTVETALCALQNIIGLFGNVPTSCNNSFEKRALSDGLQGLLDFFKPHVQAIVDNVKGLGETLKGHANNLLATVNTHASTLKDKLSGHVDELKTHGQTILGHGQNAVNALKDAVTDILKQTFTNLQPALNGATDTLKGAAGTITNHLTDAVKNAATSGN